MKIIINNFFLNVVKNSHLLFTGFEPVSFLHEQQYPPLDIKGKHLDTLCYNVDMKNMSVTSSMLLPEPKNRQLTEVNNTHCRIRQQKYTQSSKSPMVAFYLIRWKPKFNILICEERVC